MSDSTENQVRRVSPWLNRLIIVLFIFLLISAGANYLLITNYIENQQTIECLELELKIWESSFRHFYFYANKDWPDAERYALAILTKAFSEKLAKEQNWTIKDQLEWEADPEKGEAYIKKILK